MMTIVSQAEVQFNEEGFLKYCKNSSFEINNTIDLNTALIDYFYDEYETLECQILEEHLEGINKKIWEKYFSKPFVSNTMEKEIQFEIENNYNFEDLIRTIMDEYYSQGYQIEKIENQIASACIAKINQISWQKAINALKN